MTNKKVLDFSRSSIIARVVTEAVRRKSSGSVLDLGAGSGRHAIFLATKGFSVTAVDDDAEAINRLKILARSKKISIKCERANIARYQPKKKFDIVVAINSLHFLKADQIPKIINRIKGCTSTGGLNIIAAHTDRNPKGSRPHLFQKNELKQYYSDWNILKYTEKFGAPFLNQHGDGPFRKYRAEIIAKNQKSDDEADEDPSNPSSHSGQKHPRTLRTSSMTASRGHKLYFTYDSQIRFVFSFWHS